MHGHAGQMPMGPNEHRGTMLNTDFVGGTNTINMFNLIDNYRFNPVSGWVWVPVHCFSREIYYPVKTALITNH